MPQEYKNELFLHEWSKISRWLNWSWVLNAKPEAEKTGKRAFQGKRTARVKLQRNKSASKNRNLIEWGQFIKGIT